jgi:hypothetical protein
LSSPWSSALSICSTVAVRSQLASRCKEVVEVRPRDPPNVTLFDWREAAAPKPSVDGCEADACETVDVGSGEKDPVMKAIVGAVVDVDRCWGLLRLADDGAGYGFEFGKPGRFGHAPLSQVCAMSVNRDRDVPGDVSVNRHDKQRCGHDEPST